MKLSEGSSCLQDLMSFGRLNLSKSLLNLTHSGVYEDVDEVSLARTGQATPLWLAWGCDNLVILSMAAVVRLVPMGWQDRSGILAGLEV